MFFRRMKRKYPSTRLKFTLAREVVDDAADRPGVYTFWLDAYSGTAARTKPCIRKQPFLGSLNDLYRISRTRSRIDAYRYVRLTLHDSVLFVDDRQLRPITYGELLGQPVPQEA